MRQIVTIALLCLAVCFLVQVSTVESKNSVRLQDIEVLTFTRGDNTQGRRRSGVPQLRCTGGSARGKYEPYTVMCRNIGFDGHDVAWKCEADLPNEYSLGKVTVTCEGYDYPEDLYVLRDSCGLEYNLEYSETGKNYRNSPDDYPNSRHSGEHTRNYEHEGFIAGILYTVRDWISKIFSFPMSIARWIFNFMYRSSTTLFKILTALGAMLIGLSLFRVFSSRRQYKNFPKTTTTSAGRAPQSMGLAGGSNEQGTGPGFWTGLLGGSALTYLFRRNQPQEVLYQRPDGTWSRDPREAAVTTATVPAPATHESVAYGTTKRR